MKLVFVSGTQGSGKTSLVREIIALLQNRGQQAAVIVNEEGSLAYDANFSQTFGVAVKSIRGG